MLTCAQSPSFWHRHALLATVFDISKGIMWYAIGYSLTFGSSCNRNGCGSYDLLNETSGEMEETAINGFIGDLTDYYFFNNVLSHDCAGLTIPHTLFATFQMTFALMVPVLVTGAWAEKFKFSSACLFMIIWYVLLRYDSSMTS